ncbi:MAG: phage holin family protein [Candidatus Lutibacillus vidarii]|mgnify:FL=1|nr:phage holin family protein [Candidatus Lutibacillus vidarii]HON74063.1 phage holin family protein [Dermatophilaceae bacterium]HRB98493.1 phage holin family protein [Dermatophilaceae bacterium]
MKTFLIKIGINAVALWVAATVVPGIALGESKDLGSNLITVLLVALIFGLVNAIVRPIAKLFALPALVLTLGLFIFVINALMLVLTSYIAGKLGLAFSISEFFWSAVMGAVVITAVSWFLSIILPGDNS